MASSILSMLFCSCFRSRVEDDPTVIPTETTHLIGPESAGFSSTSLADTITVDRQKLHDRMSTIVRSKEGKMVNVSARVPFTIHSASESASSSAPASPPSASGLVSPKTPTSPTLPQPSASRGQVLTLTPARMRLRADSRYSSPSGSRSSSRRRTDHSDRNSSHANSVAGRGKQMPLIPTQWFGDTESESSAAGVEEAKSPVLAIPSPIGRGKDDPNAMDIAFSWSDT
ncbi:hypothetical protein MSAN_01125200 [Mycena sanguinolenta]|uniref:Uncharacterized protein n=1 Tax=Mycena sanguinolenta TaxID=230812 RepID=A0A8H6YMH9_9AGAR|nr:hypothetical protein MSAN_01125200 [Mycena sanguinolenta]